MTKSDLKKILLSRLGIESEKACEHRLSLPEGFTVLVVDDLKINLTVAKGILNGIGVPLILTALSAEEGLRLATESVPSVIFTDMWMPGTDGSAFLRLLRNQPETARIPVFAITAEQNPLATFDLTGFAGVLVKPLTAEMLSQAISQTKE